MNYLKQLNCSSLKSVVKRRLKGTKKVKPIALAFFLCGCNQSQIFPQIRRQMYNLFFGYKTVFSPSPVSSFVRPLAMHGNWMTTNDLESQLFSRLYAKICKLQVVLWNWDSKKYGLNYDSINVVFFVPWWDRKAHSRKDAKRKKFPWKGKQQ